MSLVENKVYSEGGFNQSIRLNSLNIFEFNMVGSITKNVDNFYCTGGWFTLKNGNSNRNMVVVKHFKLYVGEITLFDSPNGVVLPGTQINIGNYSNGFGFDLDRIFVWDVPVVARCKLMLVAELTFSLIFENVWVQNDKRLIFTQTEH